MLAPNHHLIATIGLCVDQRRAKRFDISLTTTPHPRNRMARPSSPSMFDQRWTVLVVFRHASPPLRKRYGRASGKTRVLGRAVLPHSLYLSSEDSFLVCYALLDLHPLIGFILLPPPILYYTSPIDHALPLISGITTHGPSPKLCNPTLSRCDQIEAALSRWPPFRAGGYEVGPLAISILLLAFA
jgi:hypothetical protein